MDVRNKLVFDPGRPFRPSLMFVGKAAACPSEALSRCSTLGKAPGLTYTLGLERPAMDIHSSLLQMCVNYGHKLLPFGPSCKN
jgi:hypothetical protein